MRLPDAPWPPRRVTRWRSARAFSVPARHRFPGACSGKACQRGRPETLPDPLLTSCVQTGDFAPTTTDIFETSPAHLFTAQAEW